MCKKHKKMLEEEAYENDPFSKFGPGIVSYFKIMYYLMFAFFVLTILFIPVMSLYVHGETMLTTKVTGYHR